MKKQKKQWIVLAASILFLLLSIGYSIHHFDNSKKSDGKFGACEDIDSVDAETVMNDELEIMEALAIVLENAYSKDDITKENKVRIMKMAEQWAYLIKQKNAYSKEERKKAVPKLRKNSKEILNRMHKAQAALLTKKDGHNLMLAVKIILDKSKTGSTRNNSKEKKRKIF